MTFRNRRDDWLDNDEYPDDDDIEAFGDDSPRDYDPLTIGRLPRAQTPFWTRGRIIIALVALLLLLALLIEDLFPLLIP